MLGRLVLLIVGINAALGVAMFFGLRAVIRRFVWKLFGKPDPEDDPGG